MSSNSQVRAASAVAFLAAIASLAISLPWSSDASPVVQAGYPNDMLCNSGQMSPWEHTCACETGSNTIGCTKSRPAPGHSETVDYDCIDEPGQDCTQPVEGCGKQMTCNPPCNASNRVCNETTTDCVKQWKCSPAP